jgi:hypothetical protein
MLNKDLDPNHPHLHHPNQTFHHHPILPDNQNQNQTYLPQLVCLELFQHA